MIAVIYDVNKNWIEDKDGTFESGLFVYKVGGFTVPILGWKFLTEDKKIKCDYKLSIRRKGTREVYYKFDGKDYEQLSLGDIPSDYHSSEYDYSVDSKLSQYAIDAALTKPEDNSLLKNAISIILVALALVILFYTQQDITAAKALNAPYAHAVNVSAQLAVAGLNESKYCLTNLNQSYHEIALLQKSGA